MTQRLINKIALVTGAAGGLGQAICKRLAAEGARVVVTDIHQAKAQGVAEAIGESAMAIALDVTSENSWRDGLSAVTAKWGGLDILVNNAGYLKPATIEEATLHDWQTVQRINGDSVFLGCKPDCQHDRRRT